MEVSKGIVEELGEDADAVFLQGNTSLYGQFIPGAPEVMNNPWDLLEAVRPSPDG